MKNNNNNNHNTFIEESVGSEVLSGVSKARLNKIVRDIEEVAAYKGLTVEFSVKSEWIELNYYTRNGEQWNPLEAGHAIGRYTIILEGAYYCPLEVRWYYDTRVDSETVNKVEHAVDKLSWYFISRLDGFNGDFWLYASDQGAAEVAGQLEWQARQND